MLDHTTSSDGVNPMPFDNVGESYVQPQRGAIHIMARGSMATLSRAFPASPIISPDLVALETAKHNIGTELALVLYIRKVRPETATAAAPLIRDYGRMRLTLTEQIHALKNRA